MHPHPDDLEFGCANLIKFLVEAGQRVIVVSLTKGEFGLPTSGDAFKGPRLGRIRTRELIAAGRAHGVERVIFLGAVDGFVKINWRSFSSVRKVIDAFHPDVIFAPEPYLTYYWHPDHVATGWLAWLLVQRLRRMEPNRSLKLFYFNTIRNEVHVPFQSTAHGLATIALHQSQAWLMRPISLIYGPLYRIIAGKMSRARYAEGFRRLRFDPSDFTLKSPLEHWIVSTCSTIFQKFAGDAMYQVGGQRPPFLDDLLSGKIYLPKELNFELGKPGERK